ncbi:hypothetical protein TorRG33x02_318660 [Trema orientale]|uniref:Putative plant transposon protein domain-containing protein n=1 Tax=Trema orientale TaxID=63057 RepID=A0A2P5BJU3_TREOI|nr:hypothetical protein TorRG33x02_318660 [Trema orientale]
MGTEEDPSMETEPSKVQSDIPKEPESSESGDDDEPEIEVPKSSKDMGKAVQSGTFEGYVVSKAYFTSFYTIENEALMKDYEKRTFWDERNFNLDSLKPLGIVKILKDLQWMKTVTGFEGYVPRIVQEFYCNIHEDMADPLSPFYQKVYVRGHVYEFSFLTIADFLDIPMVELDEYEKEYAIDTVASELLGDVTVWPDDSHALKSCELTYKYSGLHKIAQHNWWPTAHQPTVAKNFACFLFDVGIGFQVNLPHIIFHVIYDLRGGRKKNQKLPFPNLIYGILQQQHPLMLQNDFFSPVLPTVSYRLKGKEVVEPPVATTVKSKKKTTAAKKSSPVATPSGVVSQESMELENLNADQVKQSERLEAIEKVQKEILDRLTAAFAAPSVVAPHPSGSSQPEVPASPSVATSPEKQAKKRYKKTQL